MTRARERRVAVVLPVRDASGLVDACLEALRPEVARHDADLVVVDDASSDDTARRATRHDHVRLLAHPTPRGPYAARETGWRASTADVVAFVDVRCRVHDGWLAALLAGLEVPGVAVTGAGYRVVPGRSVAARAAAAQDGFRVTAGLEEAPVPFLPGGNLAVRREVLEAVGGFDTTLRSGGDLVLCGEVQARGLGTVTNAPGAQVDWVPRDRVLDLVRQRARYGRARVDLQRRFAERLGTPPELPSTLPALAQLAEARRRRRDHPELGLPVHAAVTLAEYAHARAHRRAYRDAAAADPSLPPPRTLADVLRDRVR